MGIQQVENDFWYEFDKLFEPNPSGMDPEVSRAYAMLFPNFVFDRLLIMWWRSRRESDYPKGFINNLTEPMRNSIKNLTKLQFKIIDKHFRDDPTMQREAFEDFAQGILYDTRRVNGKKIHKMDGDPPVILVGYYRWYVFIRAMSLVNEANSERLLELEQQISLAWAIESEMHPVHDDDDLEPNPGQNPNNQAIDPARLRDLESFWLSQSFDQLDKIFDNDELSAYMKLIGVNR